MTDTKTAQIHLSDDSPLIVKIRDRACQSLDDAKTNLADGIG
jgi:hypothetical protein